MLGTIHVINDKRSLACPLDTLVNVIHWPNSNIDTFSCFDLRQAHLWKGKYRVQSQSVVQETGRKAKPTALSGLVAWTYVAKWRILIIANTQLELKILDANFEELCTKSIEKPALCLEFDDEADELIVGGVCNIRIWGFTKVAEKGRFVHTFVGPRLVIEDLRNEEWVSKTMYHKLSHKIYAIVDNNVYIYDSRTGERLSSMLEIHSLSVTSLLYLDGYQYLITAAKDGVIKVWNFAGFLVSVSEIHL
jgi:WD40 repeat protein